YHFSTHAIRNIVFSPGPHISAGSHAFCTLNQHIDIAFDYVTNEATGVRIFARPFSSGALTPNYAAHGSPAFPSGSGSGNGYFTITSGNALVDQVRFHMLNENQSQLLLEFFMPAAYVFGNPMPTGVTASADPRPEDYVLEQNYPNPFNSGTTIEFVLPEYSFITLKVYNLRGEQVAVLLGEERPAGVHIIVWDAAGLASGVYLYQLDTGRFVQSRKLLLIR
ncbi:T9SS type A sorting domain-containing protein, partial [candidate division KSB1 bacterium]|nr:T9SS type A sorting domain-containing protein [candidate division KSB1 bacterium]